MRWIENAICGQGIEEEADLIADLEQALTRL